MLKCLEKEKVPGVVSAREVSVININLSDLCDQHA